MRAASLALVVLAIFGLSSCKDRDTAINRDLSEDLALAASNDGLNLAPAPSSRGTVSALEQVQRQTPRVARAQRQVTYRPAVAARTQAPVQLAVDVSPAAPIAEPEAPVATAPVVPEPAPVAPTPAPTPEPAPAPTPSVRPQPIPVATAPEPSDIGSTPRVPIGVVIRGGRVDGDHCDPRTDRRRGGMISINNRIPTPRTF